jgi:hypothetical protein
MFSAPEKVTVNTPRFTSEPPQIHHRKTTFNTPFFAKPPSKEAFYRNKKIHTFCPTKLRLPLVKSKEKAQAFYI